MRKKMLAFGGAALLALLPVSAATGTASASSVCRAGSVCTWSKNDFGGTKRTSRVNPSPGCNPWSGKTVSNQTKRTIRLYSDVSCYGSHNDVKPKHWGQTKPGATVKSIAVIGP
ncbi:peptidase inhibitor family I36 protein [Streptomyces sp. NPDC087440]|uniref:peptidase inhibitor family I36 protein n=1 Tax=Streptomyces sp. NPDC087440 TaxID=3365790 RepID=UPI00382F72AE